MTGRYQQRLGGLECAIGVGNVGRYDEAEWLQKRGELGLPVSQTSIARMFQSHGYDTACFGKWHLGYLDKFSPNAHGFDEYLGVLGGNSDYFMHVEQSGGPALYRNGQRIDQKGYLTDLFAEEAIRWLKAQGSRQPFFLYGPFTAPHQPYQGPEDSGKPALWDNGSRATYVSMVERMDYQVGRIVEQLDRMGAAENTLLIFISDNGATPGAGEESGPDTDGPREPHRLACRSDHQRRCG
jgi:N-acetylgalactosamine-6-sulfatase